MTRYGQNWIWIFIFFLAACAPVKREVKENTFSSDIPKLKLKVNDEFKFLGEKKEKENYQHILMPNGWVSKIDHDIFSFVKKGPHPSGVYVVVSESDGTLFFSSPQESSKTPKEWVYVKGYLDGKYDYYMQTYLNSDNSADNTIKNNCYMVRELQKYFGFDFNTGRLSIVYKEPLAALEDQDLQCGSWKPFLADLDEKHKKFLSEFSVRAEESVEFLK